MEVPIGGSLARDSHEDVAEIVDGAEGKRKVIARGGGYDAGIGGGRHFGGAVGGRGEVGAEFADIGEGGGRRGGAAALPGF